MTISRSKKEFRDYVRKYADNLRAAQPDKKKARPNHVVIEEMPFNLGSAVTALCLGHYEAAIDFIQHEIKRLKR